MKIIRLFFLSSFISLYTITLLSQSYIGHTVDNYAGIHGVIYNPANVVSSKFRADINLFSVSVFGGSDYFGINAGDLINSSAEFEFDDTETFPTNNNNFFLNADVLGPSFMFNLNKKSSIGITTRVRGIFNLNEINGELYENLVDDFDDDNDFSFESENLTGTVHAWAEIGLSYGRVLMDKPNHLLTGGVTLKYLMGAGAVFVNSPNLQGTFFSDTETLETQGFLNYGVTQDFDSDDIDFSDFTTGFGFDLGFVYEWHKDKDDDLAHYQSPYKLKLGISITDIGSISYDDAELTSYDLNATVSTDTFEDDIEEFLDNNYNNTAENQNAKIQLPTALHLLIDYRLTNKLLISAQGDFSLTDSGDALSNRFINNITISPRLETKWFSLYAPISFRQYGDFAFGTGLRFGPLSIGSASVLSNLLSDSSKTTDVFVGLKVPLYRK